MGLALLWHTARAAEQAEGRVVLEVVTVSAAGRGGEPKFDPRIPNKLKKQLRQSHLAYDQYTFGSRQEKTTGFGERAAFPLPEKEALLVTPSPYDSRTHPVSLDVRILNSEKKSIMKTQLRMRYGGVFLLHRPRRSAALLIGLSAERPKD